MLNNLSMVTVSKETAELQPQIYLSQSSGSRGVLFIQEHVITKNEKDRRLLV